MTEVGIPKGDVQTEWVPQSLGTPVGARTGNGPLGDASAGVTAVTDSVSSSLDTGLGRLRGGRATPRWSLDLAFSWDLTEIWTSSSKPLGLQA